MVVEHLNALIDLLAAGRLASRCRGGAREDHAWIIVGDHGFNLEVYFTESTRQDSIVRFVLHGPHVCGEPTSIYDDRALFGVVATKCLKGLLSQINHGSSPLEYVQCSAIEVAVFTD